MTASLDALAQAVDCDTAETVRWEIAETLDKCAGTKARILAQIEAGEDCDTCPPGFLAVVMQAEKLARALDIALDLLKVPAIDPEKPRELTPPWHARVSRVLDGFTYQTMYLHRFALADPPVVRACVAQVREQALRHWEEHYGGEHGRVRFHFEWSPDIPDDAVVLTAIVPPLGAAVCDPAPKRKGGNA